MMTMASTPTNPIVKRSCGHRYWVSTWYDDDGHRRSKSFGSASIVSKSEARRQYKRWMAQWYSDPMIQTPREVFAIEDLAQTYEDFAEQYYRHPDGTVTREHLNVHYALKPFVELFGDFDPAEIRPRHFEAYQNYLIKADISRTTINQRCNIVRRWARWLVSKELAPPSLLQYLESVTPLKRGRTEACESAGVTVVSEEIVLLTLERCTPTLQAMIRLQLLTAMRPGELTVMRPLDINITESPWLYRPRSDKGKFGQHKTSHHGHDRRIYLGKEAQQIIEPFMNRPLLQYLFSPREANAQRREQQHKQRRTPLSCGNKPGTNRKENPKKQPSEQYTPGTYRQAIHHACHAIFDPDGQKRKRKEKDHLWSPNQLRHTALTRIERQFGYDKARAVGGHTKVETTQIYVERDMSLAIEVAQEAG